MINMAIIQSALELGFIYALVSLALFLSYSILDIADLTTDGAFTLGCAVSAAVTLAGHPFLAFPVAMAAGVAAGFITALLQTKFGVPSILAGIVTNTGLYTVNLAVMGFSSNLNLFKSDSIFTAAKNLFAGTALESWYKLLIVALITVLLCLLLVAFLKTRIGLSIRATGDNKDMVRASSVNPAATITIGLCIANAMTALSGAVLAQYQKTADINIGTGMVVIGLAGLIIGQTLIGKGSMLRSVAAVLCGSIIYRFIMALALRSSLDVSALKLVSAVIVGVAISIPAMKSRIALERSKRKALRAEKEDANA